VPHWFDNLTSTGDLVADVRRLLRAAGRVDTLRHVSRVAAVGRRLARRFDLPVASSDLACTAHDLAAVVPLREILAVAEVLGVRLSPADRAIPQVVHGPVAAEILAQRLRVRDRSVLDAVRYHTTLRARAGPLEMLTFVADKIAYDPTMRAVSFYPALRAARDTASLSGLCLIYLEWAVREGPRLGWQLHPRLVAAHADLSARLDAAPLMDAAQPGRCASPPHRRRTRGPC
jgi:predicted HD superfamily hydrolase involved in NAD metabolism